MLVCNASGASDASGASAKSAKIIGSGKSSRQMCPHWRVEAALAAGPDNPQWIIGCDEVGRGCLAGPVMVGACAFRLPDLRPPDYASEHKFDYESDYESAMTASIPSGLKDSKLLTEKKREALYDPLASWSDTWAVGSASNKEIDQVGIISALGLAAVRALDQIGQTISGSSSGAIDAPEETEGTDDHSSREVRVLNPLPASLILDGPYDYISPILQSILLPDQIRSRFAFRLSVTTVVKGDQTCASVAAASVMAKVTRDRYMIRLADKNPQWEPYGWAHNKGYGTAQHRRAIKDLGPTSYHRVSWCKLNE